MSPSTDDIRRDDQLLDLLGRRRPVSRDDPAALLLSAWSLEIDAGLPRRAPVARRSGRALGIVLSLLLTVGGGSVAAALSGTQLPVLTTVGSALIGWVPGVQLPEVEDAGAKGSTVTMQALDTRSPAASEVRPPSVLTGADHAGSADLLVAGALIGMDPLGPTTDAASVVPPPAGSVLSPPAEAAAGSAGQTSDAVSADTTSKPRHTGAPDKADKADKATRTVKGDDAGPAGQEHPAGDHLATGDDRVTGQGHPSPRHRAAGHAAGSG